MNMKRNDFIPKKELKNGNWLDNRWKEKNEKAFISNTLTSALFFYKNQSNWTLGLLSLNFSRLLGYIVLDLFIIFYRLFLTEIKEIKEDLFYCSFSVQSVKKFSYVKV